MKTVGLVTEYNPFHNGHKYHIEEAKRITGADYVIAVMSGNFVQRGIPAVIDKYTRAEMALRNGADVVLELPVCYATGSAEFFAHGAVSLLERLGVVDYLCFGSECGDIRLLNEAAQFILEAPASFDENLQVYLKDGLTYPAARQKALQQTSTTDPIANKNELSKVLTEPNNILGIEYIKAIRRLNSSITPVTIQRMSAHYHEERLAGKVPSGAVNNSALEVNSAGLTISSATAIRKAIHSTDNSGDDLMKIEQSIPDNVFQILKAHYGITYPITEEDFASIIKYKLLSLNHLSLTGYLDITQDLAGRIKNITDYYCSIKELCQRIKTKNMTLTRINRALIHLLLNIKTDTVTEYNRNGYSQYARVLGIKKESSQLLRAIEKAERIPIITKVSKAEEQLDALGMQMLSEDLFAAEVYNQAVYNKFGTSLPNEYRHGICII